MKWARDGGAFTFNDLIKAKEKSPSLIHELAAGSQRITEANPGRAVFVHLVTNEIASVSGVLPVANLKPTPAHFSAFLSQVWYPIHRGEKTEPPPVWREAWDRLRQASGVPQPEWLNFVRRCILEFGYHPPETTEASASDQTQFERDINALTLLLFGVPGSPERIVELSRAELIKQLAWQGRFEFKATHEFPVSDELYEPIESTRQKLQHALDDLSNGYVAVLGTPGSGKSTLLTEVLRKRKERVVRYYAYIPDSPTPLALRGESASFLHDVVLALDRAGVRAGSGLIGLDRTQLQQRLHEQLLRLHSEWRQGGPKTFILVDGLDHIEREQHPERSLLCDLPVPEQVPDGVLFVLGSQTDQLQDLPDRIQYAVRQPERRIEMEPLTRTAVSAVVRRSKLLKPTFPEFEDRVFKASDGHPLALMLIIDRLKEAIDDVSVETALTAWTEHAGDVREEYFSYWRSIGGDSGVARLLALLARLRRPIDLEWVRTWAGPADTEHFASSARHYFRREGSRWYFFHNSFRQFLLRATAEGVDRDFDAGADRAYHAELADHCMLATAHIWNWEELYHRSQAGQASAMLDTATPDYFRRQFFDLRPLDRINTDIDLCFQSLRRVRDVPKLASLILAGSEMRQRASELSDEWVIGVLLDLGKREIATEHLRDGRVLLTGNGFALRIAERLKREGAEHEANLLFELAEPLDLLHGIVDDAHRSNRDIRGELEAWASAAPLFRDVTEAIDTIKTLPEIRLSPDPLEMVDDLKTDLLFECGLGLLRDQRWAELERLIQSLDRSRPDENSGRFWLNVRRCQTYIEIQDQDKARAEIQDILGEMPAQFGMDAEIRTASLAYRILGEMTLAQDIVSRERIPVPDPHKFSFTAGDFGQFQHLYEFRRLQRIAGKPQPVFDIALASDIPDAEKIAYFVGCVAVVADISAEAWLGHRMDTASISNRALPLLRIEQFARDGQGMSPASSSQLLGRVGPELYQLLVFAVAQHGREALEQLQSDFEAEWRSERSQRSWPMALRRGIIAALHDSGAPLRWCRAQLVALEADMLAGHDVNGRIGECQKQCEAWLELGDFAAAERNLQSCLTVSFGVGFRKDYQLGSWIDWLPDVNRLDPGGAAGRIAWFAQATASLRDSTEGRAAYLAAKDLLEAAFQCSPRNAVKLFWWLVEHQVMSFASGAAILLRASLNRADNTDWRIVETILYELVLPVATSGDPELADRFIQRVESVEGRFAAIDATHRLLARISYASLQSTHGAWWAGVRRAVARLKLGLEVPRDDGRDWKEHSNRLLQLAHDSEPLTTEEVVARISSAQDLHTLMASAKNSSFEWAAVIDQVGPLLSRGDLEDAVKFADTRSERSPLLAALSERATVLGESEYGWELGERALAASPYYGWDGAMSGDRLTVFRALIKSDPSRAREMAYADLMRSLTSEFNYPQNFARNLLSILPLLSDQNLTLRVWENVEPYVHRLFGDLGPIVDGPSFFEASQDSPTFAMCDLVLACIDHVAYPIAHAAQRCCRRLLIDGVLEMSSLLKEELRGGSGKVVFLNSVLESVAGSNWKTVEQFRNELDELSISRDMAIRESAARLVGVIDQHPSTVRRSPRQLPASYELDVPVLRIWSAGQAERPEAGKPLPDSNDPRLLVRPFNDQLSIIAHVARIPETNVLTRLVQLMHELRPSSEWSASGEGGVRRILDSADLKLPFVRPRTALVRRAMFHLVAELYDAGLFDLTEIHELEPVLRYYDSSMLDHEPGEPPLDLALLKMGDFGVRSGFMAELDALQVLPNLERVGESYVLAENTSLKSLDWSMETEKRRSLIVSESGHSSDRDIDAPVVYHAYKREYESLVPNPTRALTIRNRGEQFDSPGRNWVAFNPQLARSLGWKLSPTGLFQWLGSDGTPRVQTVWWGFGGVQSTPPRLRDQVGEGWLVLASPAGLSAIISQFGALQRHASVERSVTVDGERKTIERTITSGVRF